MRRALTAIAALAGGLAVAAVPSAGASARHAVSKHTFDVRATAICRAANRAGSKVGDPMDAAGYMRAAAALQTIADTALVELKRLEPPAALRRTWHSYLLGLRHETTFAVAGLNAAAAGNGAAAAHLFARLSKLTPIQSGYARRLGVPSCPS